MKTVTQIEEASLSSGLETAAMGMVLNATSFNHIINSLYKNPLGAIIRELTTNALESHMVANTTRKVAIQLPTAYDQNFVIRDFGTGLDDEEVQKYLNTLFSTSKDKDNNLMGGFGLGSKSPLALVDTFNIISIKNGLKNNYSWIKEPGKLPSLVYLDDEEDRNERTVEDDGIKIVIPLGSSTKISQTSLQIKVEEEARRQLLGFTGKFMFVDNIHTEHYADLKDITSTVIKETLVLDLDHVALFKKDPNTFYPHSNTMLIMIGGVNYPFADGYRQYVRSLFQYFIDAESSYIVCLKAPIGSLELPMSREEILTTSHNENVLKACSESARKDISDHIKSLNIDLEVDVATFYKQLKNVTSNLTNSNGVQFKLEIQQDTFEKKDTKLNAYYNAVRALPSSSYKSKSCLQVRHLLNDRLPTRIFQELTSTAALTINVFDNAGNRERCSNGYVTSIHNQPYSFLLTTSPLPSGVSHNLLHMFAKEKLKMKHNLIVVQVDDTLHASFKDVFNVIEAHSEYFLKEPHEDLGALDLQAIADYKEELKLANKSPNGRASYTRATIDFIPGARLFDMSNYSSSNFYVSSCHLNFHNVDSKVTALEDLNGKRIAIGPDYIPAGKSVLLTCDHVVPVNLQAFAEKGASVQSNSLKHPENFSVYKTALMSPLKDTVLLKVTTASYKSCLQRLIDANVTVYTKSNEFVLNRPTVKDIPPLQLGRNMINLTLNHLTNKLGLWSRSQEYISATTMDILKKTLPLYISDPLYLNACNVAIASCKSNMDLFRSMHTTSLEEYEGYSNDKTSNLSRILSDAMFKELLSSTDTEVNRNLFELVSQGLKKEVFEHIITNLITVAAKGKTNEIQTQNDSAS